MTTTTSTTIRSLSQETLLRFRERAAHHDAVGRYAVEDLADLRAAGWFTAALPEDLGGLGLTSPSSAANSAGWRATRRPRPCRPACTTTGSAWPQTCTASGHPRRSLHHRVRHWTATSSPPGTPRSATTSRWRCPPPRAEPRRRAAGGSPAGRCSARSARTGTGSGSTPWTPAIRPRPVVVHGFVPHDAPGLTTVVELGRPGHAGHREPRHRARGRVRPRRGRALRRSGRTAEPSRRSG